MSAKILFLDIEATHLKADFGTVLCVGLKWLGDKKIHCPRVDEDDPTNDCHAVKIAAEAISQSDMLVTYYGKGFDIPYLQAKWMEYNIPIPDPVPHVDLYFVAKSHLALSRKSLDNVSRFIGCPTGKTRIEPKVWKRAAAGFQGDIDYIVKHCVADIKITEETYLKLRPLIRTHPKLVTDVFSCHVCGSEWLQRRGLSLSHGRKKQRVMCNDCGAWGLIKVS